MSSTSMHGIRYVAFAALDEKGVIITGEEKGLSESGVVVVDGDGQGATQANITGMEEAGTLQWANNKSKRAAHGKPQPQVALIFLDMAYKLLQKMKGFTSDAKGGYVPTSGKKPHIAMLICSSGFDGDDYFEGFANGELIEAGHNHGTDTNAEVDANTTLTYQALTPLDDNVFLDGKGVQQPYKLWVSSENGFDIDVMGSEVFGGIKTVKEVLGSVVSSGETEVVDNTGNGTTDPK